MRNHSVDLDRLADLQVRACVTCERGRTPETRDSETPYAALSVISVDLRNAKFSFLFKSKCDSDKVLSSRIYSSEAAWLRDTSVELLLSAYRLKSYYKQCST